MDGSTFEWHGHDYQQTPRLLWLGSTLSCKGNELLNLKLDHLANISNSFEYGAGVPAMVSLACRIIWDKWRVVRSISNISPLMSEIYMNLLVISSVMP